MVPIVLLVYIGCRCGSHSFINLYLVLGVVPIVLLSILGVGVVPIVLLVYPGRWG